MRRCSGAHRPGSPGRWYSRPWSIAKKRDMRLITGLAVLVLLAAQVQAAAPAVVDTVQMPAWLDRGGETQPLTLGAEVKNGDRLRTGKAGRAYLKLVDGSMVKLGESATLAFYSLTLRPERRFKGALDVLGGAFRFTTDAVDRAGGNRQLDIRVGSATAGIRGTDLWGKSDAQRDLICLIEGHIELSHAGATQDMTDPLSYFVAPKNAAALPLARVEPEQLQRWARETEVLPGDGAARRGGKWKLLLGTVDEEKQALAIYDQARAAGYATQIRPRGGGGKWTYQVLIAALASAEEAAALAARVRSDLGLVAGVTR